MEAKEEQKYDLLESKVNEILDLIGDKVEGLNVIDGEMVMLNVAETLITMSSMRMNEKGIDAILDLVCKTVRWNLKEAHEKE